MTEAEPIVIDLRGLLLLEGNQIRAKTESATVRRYAELMAGGTIFPPIKVALTDPNDANKGYTLVDGWHRTRATQANGLGTIVAEVVPGRAHEIPWLAYEANRGHGLPLRLTRLERREIFRAYVKAKRYLSGRGRAMKSANAMARDLVGVVSARALPGWMAADFPAIYRAMNMGGLDPYEDQGGVKDRDLDAAYAREAGACLDNFMACMRSLQDNRRALAILRKAVTCVDEVSEAVTGRREWPKVAGDLF
ncbi:hypothetical protein [Rhizobium laguerreae]|uniref:ParB/Sulfiredoxin domain-containing protein n=1 Tax=Rhizobium laguerreae TaxID=1076926 RepID=A0A7Y2W964_9HYPH|nr:hypothetical protein [Rhizobium laguerreae]NNH68240.1 hypothetical protein [Rhizobium laguerreae]